MSGSGSSGAVGGNNAPTNTGSTNNSTEAEFSASLEETRPRQVTRPRRVNADPSGTEVTFHEEITIKADKTITVEAVKLDETLRSPPPYGLVGSNDKKAGENNKSSTKNSKATVRDEIVKLVYA